MKQVLTLRFAAAFALSIGILFYDNPLNIDSMAWRSALAGIVAGIVGGLLPGGSDRYALIPTLGTIVTATVYAVIYFGNLFHIDGILPRLFAAIILGSLAGGATDLVARRFRDGLTAAILSAVALGLTTAYVQAAPPDSQAAWASGYAAAVARACPDWHTNAAAMDSAGGVPDLQHGDEWAPQTPAAKSFAAGAHAADAARINKAFCEDPASTSPAGNLVSKFLIRGRLPP